MLFPRPEIVLFPRPEPTGTRQVTLIQSLLPTSPLGDVREEALHRLTQISLGQQMEADVQAKLTDGSFLVKIADATAQMNLPASTNVGDKVSLTLIGKEPRPTFLLNTEPTLLVPSSTTSLSSAAQFIDTLMHNFPNSADASPIIGKTPIVPQAKLPTPQLAAALQDTLAKTGVFYESHLNSWVNGQISLTEIKQEPQAQQVNQITRNNAEVNSPQHATGATALTQPRDGQMNPLTASTEITAPPMANQPLAQIVNQQLQMLEQNRIIWQGEVWPGQTMRWEVSEEAPETISAPEQSSWRSEVRFEMPQLGTITATLKLTGPRLTLQIRTDNAETAAQLQSQGTKLSDALAAAGIPLDGLQVRKNE